ncbi:hypothetical protein GCM10009554_09330 [Kribbella koreensis]|uniref:Uncharacterized protein n=1 Tax=Kribbella koreensis TaxID=57909 RepID=A0ABN1PH78_9ACTN
MSVAAAWQSENGGPLGSQRPDRWFRFGGRSMMAVGGVDTYYDYDEKQWKSRRLGGGPISHGPVCPTPKSASAEDAPDAHRHRPGRLKPADRRTSV